jgi:hypothetical protein
MEVSSVEKRAEFALSVALPPASEIVAMPPVT